MWTAVHEGGGQVLSVYCAVWRVIDVQAPQYRFRVVSPHTKLVRRARLILGWQEKIRGNCHVRVHTTATMLAERGSITPYAGSDFRLGFTEGVCTLSAVVLGRQQRVMRVQENKETVFLL